MHERISSILGRTICGIVVAERTIGDSRFELHLCFSDGSIYEINSSAPQWGHHGGGYLSMVVERIAPTASIVVYGDGIPNRPTTRKRLSRGIAYRVPILQILREHGGEALRLDVLAELPARMRHEQSAIDREPLPSGIERWKRSVAAEVRLMRKEKLLYPAWLSGRDTWALAPAGSKIAQQLHLDYKAMMEGAAGR